VLAAEGRPEGPVAALCGHAVRNDSGVDRLRRKAEITAESMLGLGVHMRHGCFWG
jgi:hypothetical protein